MKKKILLLGMSLIFIALGSIKAQNANLQLRYIFDNLTPPSSPPADALYDMSVHMTDEKYWTNMSADTTNTPNWATMYDEFRYMLYDTTDLDVTDSVFTNAFRFKGDTVLLGMLWRNYNLLKDSTLETGDTIYFEVDTITGQLIDYPSRVDEPYLHRELFTISPLEEGVLTNYATFRIDPDYLFIDNYNIEDYIRDQSQLQVDLDDGTGWQNIDPTVVTHIPVVYTSGNSTRLIKARVINSSGATTRSSQATFIVVPSSQQVVKPDSFASMYGMNIGFFEPCLGAPQPAHEKKYVIYLEGFDIFEDVTATDVYNASIRNTKLAELRNHGYTFLVVDWQNSARDMRDNANSVISLINYLKCQLASGQNDIDTLPPFVLMGESMGGVIGRYALTKMENSVPSGCLPNLLHNTRLYVSIDAPHQGANVPMAFQELYRDVLGPLYQLPINVKVKGIWIRNYLNSKAPRQLLNRHVSTNVWPFASYYPHPDRAIFMNSMRNLDGADGYPDFVKKVSITDGLLSGEHQLDISGNNLFNAGDDFLDASAVTTLRILGIPVIGATGSVNLKAMPPTGNTFYNRNISINHWGISIQWRTIKIGPCPFCIKLKVPSGVSVGFVGSTVSSHTGVNGNIPTYDHMPGGLLSFNNAVPSGSMGNQMNFINWTVGPIGGGGAPITIPGFQLVGLNLNWSISTEGLTFNFIPVQSALDYSGSANILDHDIFSENIWTKLSRTPFDVIIGEYNRMGGYPNNGAALNRSHVTVLNHDVGLPLANGLNQYMLNREVGEEEMWMDNWRVHMAMIPRLEAEYVFTGGSMENMYYEYPGQPSSHIFYNHPSPPNNGAFSKNAPFGIGNHAVIKSGGTFIDNGIIGSYSWLNLPQFVCSKTFRVIKRDNEELASEMEEFLGISVYPNPNEGEFTIEFGEEYTNPQITVINSNAQVVYQKNALNNRTSIGSDLGLKPGVYLIQVIDAGKQPFTQKMIIQ